MQLTPLYRLLDVRQRKFDLTGVESAFGFRYSGPFEFLNEVTDSFELLVYSDVLDQGVDIVFLDGNVYSFRNAIDTKSNSD
jgi:hypothetical protein